LSIFQKDCPLCASSNSANAVRCHCGYIFEPERLEGPNREAELAAQDERLYREYLAARTKQAMREAEEARMVHASDPGNTVKAAQSLLAEQAAHAARAELNIQATKTAMAKLKATTASTAVNKPTAPPSRRSATRIKVTHAAVHANIRSNRTTKVPHVKRHVAVSTSASQTDKPGEAFKAIQAVKAQKALIKTKHASKSTAYPVKSKRNGTTFKAVQIAKAVQAAKIIKTQEMKDCPNCTATISLKTKQCRCGYVFPLSGSELPPLALSAKELAILMGGAGFGKITKFR